MLGRSHALSGATIYLAATIPAAHVVHLSPLTVAAGTLAAAGAGLLPDLDHPSATPARSFGTITQTLSHIVAWAAGGHRRATHSLVGTFVAAVLAITSTVSRASLTGLLWLCIGLGVRALWKRPRNRPNGRLDYRDVAGLAHAAVALAAAWWLAGHVQAWTVPAAVVLGYVAHLAGDTCTVQGVPWLWPSLRRYRVGSINTGSDVERLVVVPVLYAGLAAAGWFTWGGAVLAVWRG